ncbi:MAG: hypothetical protein KJ072_27225 [Verrucomicrobia bacterium]|nr:hypothetical protein [Verrucomicrobiota bacterium]
MSEASARVTLPQGVSLERVAKVLADAWDGDPRNWQASPAQIREELTEGNLPTPGDAMALFHALKDARLEYLLVGGIAMLTYVQGRNTKDIDLLMAAADARQIPGICIEEENEFFASGRFRSVRVDLLLTRNPFFEAVALNHATRHRFAELDVPAVTVEGLILLKLYALPSLYRQLDWDRIYFHESDIKQLLARYRPPVEGLLQFLKPHMIESDINELRRFLVEATDRIVEVERKGEQ